MGVEQVERLNIFADVLFTIIGGTGEGQSHHQSDNRSTRYWNATKNSHIFFEYIRMTPKSCHRGYSIPSRRCGALTECAALRRPPGMDCRQAGVPGHGFFQVAGEAHQQRLIAEAGGELYADGEAVGSFR